MRIKSIAVSSVALLLFTACGDCLGGPGRIREKKGEELAFEAISLHIDEDAFLKRAIDAFKLEGARLTRNEACRDQLAMDVPDLDEMTVVERQKGNARLSNCVVRTNQVSQSTSLVELRGEFVDGRLARLTFRMKPSELAALEKRIVDRFGAGAKISLREELVVEEKKTDYRIWQDENEIWLLSKGEAGTALLVHQDLQASEKLPPPPKAAKRGEPVSLEDLGIGKLDLNAPLPALDLPDAGPTGAR